MTRTKVIIHLLFAGAMAFAPTSSAQSLAEFKSRYPTEGVFLIKPNVLMTPYYGPKGKLCGVYLQANRFAHLPHQISAGTISPYDLEAAVLELEPKETKDKIGGSFYFTRRPSLSIAKFFYDDLSVYVTFRGVSLTENAGTAGKIYTKSTLLDFLTAFGDVETARIWWMRRDGCHDR